MSEMSGKEYAANLEKARQRALDLGAILQDKVAKAAQSTQDAAAEIANSMKGQVSYADKLSAVTQARNSYIETQVSLGRKVNQSLLAELDKQIELLAKEKEREDVQAAIAERQEEMAQSVTDFKDKVADLKNKFMAIVTDPMTALTAGLIALTAIAFQFGKEIFSASKQMGLSVGQGAELASVTAVAAGEAKLLGGSTQDALQAAEALTKEAGALGNLTAEAVNNATYLSVRFGLGAENAAKVQKAMMDVTDGTVEGAKSMQDFVSNLATANDVAPGAIMQDIAGNTELFAKFGKDGAENFIKTSIAAKKLGIEMSSITSAAEGLLDIEGSISKQMEAEVLLGRQLNLDAARQAALQGDYLTLTKELANQVGSVAEFNQMNAIQQQALADSLGMSVADTRKMVENQDKLTGLSEEALQHYKETGEIQQEGSSILNEQNLAMAQAGLTSAAAIGTLMTQLGLRTSIFGMAKATAEADKGGGGGQAGGLMEKLGKIKMSDVIKGAAAMLIVAAAVFVFAKAVQEFMNVSWEAVGMAVVSMLALVGAVALLGAIMMSGVGAVAIIAGAAAMLIVASAMLVLGVALGIIAEAIPNFMLFIPMLPQMAFGFLTLAPLLPILPFLGLGLIAFGAGMGISAIGVGLFGALGGPETISALAVSMATLVPLTNGIAMLGPAFMSMAAGIATLAGSLVLLTPMLPTLLLLGGLAGGIASIVGGGGESEGGGEDTSERLIAKLDELIGIVKQGGDVKLDGKKVGDVLTLAASPLGV